MTQTQESVVKASTSHLHTVSMFDILAKHTRASNDTKTYQRVLVIGNDTAQLAGDLMNSGCYEPAKVGITVQQAMDGLDDFDAIVQSNKKMNGVYIQSDSYDAQGNSLNGGRSFISL